MWRGDARQVVERAAEGEYLLARVAARRRKEADARLLDLRQPEDVVAQRLVAAAPREVVAAEREDRSPRRGRGPIAPGMRVESHRYAVRASSVGRDEGPHVGIAEEAGGEARRRHASRRCLDAVGARTFAATRRPGRRRCRRSAAQRRRPRRTRAPCPQQPAVVGLAAVGLARVVDRVAPRQQPQPLDALGRAVEGAHALGEPAKRAGREPAEDDAAAPRLAQDLVDPVRPPDAHAGCAMLPPPT